MSYARFGADGSDVYLYADATLGGITCCFCGLQEREWVDDEGAFFGGYYRDVGETVKASGLSTDEMLAHLRHHRAAGHHVCDGVEEEIEADRVDNDAALDDDYRAERDAERRRLLRASLASVSSMVGGGTGEGPLPPSNPCTCGHGQAMHDLNKRGERTACSVMTGPRGTPCPCPTYQPEDHT